MSEKQVRDYDKFMLRFPDGMRDAIAERAKKNGRSMNSEIVQILQDALYTPTDEELDALIEEFGHGIDFNSEREMQLKLMEKKDPLKAQVLRISDSFSERILKVLSELNNKKPT